MYSLVHISAFILCRSVFCYENSYIYHKRMYTKEILYKYYKYRWSVAFGSGILSMIIIFWILFAYVFNQGELFRTSMDTRISTKMEDWGGFATCVTAIFALVSYFLHLKPLVHRL